MTVTSADIYLVSVPVVAKLVNWVRITDGHTPHFQWLVITSVISFKGVRKITNINEKEINNSLLE